MTATTSTFISSREKNAEATTDLLRSGADHFVSKDRNVVRHLPETIH